MVLAQNRLSIWQGSRKSVYGPGNAQKASQGMGVLDIVCWACQKTLDRMERTTQCTECHKYCHPSEPNMPKCIDGTTGKCTKCFYDDKQKGRVFSSNLPRFHVHIPNKHIIQAISRRSRPVPIVMSNSKWKSWSHALKSASGWSHSARIASTTNPRLSLQACVMFAEVMLHFSAFVLLMQTLCWCR